jgi:hypothetical protein
MQRAYARVIQARPPAIRAGLAWGLLAWLNLAAATVTATLEPDTIRLGESAQMSLVFENGAPAAAPLVPSVPNLRVEPGFPSHQISIVNGQQSSAVIYPYRLTPGRAGEYTVPAVRAQVGGQILASQPLKLRVLGATEAAPAGATAQLAFLKLTVPKNEVYMGEVLPVEVRLYHIVNVDGLQVQPLAAEGFTLGKSVSLPRTRAQVGGKVYATVGMATTATATKAGALQLGPATWSLNLMLPTARRRSADPYDSFIERFMNNPFFDDPFLRAYQPVPTNLVSETLRIQVLPLPREDRPANFTGAVGDYSLAVTASPTNVAAGEPITLRIQVTGRGALDNVTLPSLDDWRDFKAYPPTSKTDTTDALGLEGVKSFEQVVVPQSPDIKELPALAFSFFDPSQKTYRTLRQAPTPIVVRPSGGISALAAAAANLEAAGSPAPARQDIVHLKTRLGAVGVLGSPLLYRPWFMALQALPVAAWLGALLWRKRREHLDRNPRIVRRQAVRRAVRQGLAQLRQLAEANQADEFFALVFHLLQEQLGERLELPAAAITEAVIDDQLRPRGVPAATLDALRDLFHVCNQARYAPLTSSQELMTFLPKVESIFADLRDLELGKLK